MTGFEDTKTMVRRNKLLGMWAAEKLGLSGAEADAYSDALALATLDADQNDVFGKIRKDFAAAGLAHSEAEILGVMDTLMLQAAGQAPTRRGEASDAAALALKRRLTSQ